MMLYLVAEGVTQTGGLDLAMNLMLGKANSVFWAQVRRGAPSDPVSCLASRLSGQSAVLLASAGRVERTRASTDEVCHPTACAILPVTHVPACLPWCHPPCCAATAMQVRMMIPVMVASAFLNNT